ncbi:head protein [Acetobacter aceti 1023]|nr:head protein [Acetobacter aceti 1023]
MEINSPNIQGLTTEIRTEFNKFLQVATPTSGPFVMNVPSKSGANFYPRLAEFPGMRKWVGSRVINRLKAGAFSVVNETYENTLAIDRDDLEDDQFGIYKPVLAQLGKEAAIMPDKLAYGIINSGTTTKCMDGQYFFDADHTTYDENGKEISYSNNATPQEGETAGPAWYLFKCDDPLKPIIYQNRRPFTITPKTQLTDGNVFNEKEFVWGIDGRCAAGCGMYQFAYRSIRPLTVESLSDAIAAMALQRRVDGEPYGIQPTHLFVPSTLRRQANAVVKGGMVPVLAPDGKTWLPGSNPAEDIVTPVVAPRLNGGNGA